MACSLVPLILIVCNFNCPEFFLPDGSFSESLYGLRRRPVKVSVKRKGPGTESSDKVYDSALRKRQKILSVVFLVGCPQLLCTLAFCLLCFFFSFPWGTILMLLQLAIGIKE